MTLNLIYLPFSPFYQNRRGEGSSLVVNCAGLAAIDPDRSQYKGQRAENMRLPLILIYLPFSRLLPALWSIAQASVASRLLQFSVSILLRGFGVLKRTVDVKLFVQRSIILPVYLWHVANDI